MYNFIKSVQKVFNQYIFIIWQCFSQNYIQQILIEAMESSYFSQKQPKTSNSTEIVEKLRLKYKHLTSGQIQLQKRSEYSSKDLLKAKYQPSTIKEQQIPTASSPKYNHLAAVPTNSRHSDYSALKANDKNHFKDSNSQTEKQTTKIQFTGDQATKLSNQKPYQSSPKSSPIKNYSSGQIYSTLYKNKQTTIKPQSNSINLANRTLPNIPEKPQSQNQAKKQINQNQRQKAINNKTLQIEKKSHFQKKQTQESLTIKKCQEPSIAQSSQNPQITKLFNVKGQIKKCVYVQQQSYERLKKLIEDKSKQIQNLNSTINQQKRAIGLLEDAKVQNDKKNQDQYKSSKEQFRKLQKEISNLKNKIKSLESSQKQLKENSVEMWQTLTRQRAISEKKNTTEVISKFEEVVKEKNNEIKILEKKIAQLQKQAKQKPQKQFDLKQQNASLQSVRFGIDSKTLMKNQENLIQEKYGKLIEVYEMDIEHLKKQLSQSKSAYEKLRELIIRPNEGELKSQQKQKVTQKVNSSNQRSAQLQRQCLQWKQKHQSIQRQLLQTKQSLAESQQKLKAVQKTSQTQQVSLLKYQYELSRSVTSNKQQEMKVKLIMNEIQAKDSLIQKLQNEAKVNAQKYQADINQFIKKSNNKESEQAKQMLNKHTAELNRRIVEYERSAKNYQKFIEQTQQKLALSGKKLKSYESKVAEYEKIKIAYERQINSLKQKNAKTIQQLSKQNQLLNQEKKLHNSEASNALKLKNQDIEELIKQNKLLIERNQMLKKQAQLTTANLNMQTQKSEQVQKSYLEQIQKIQKQVGGKLNAQTKKYSNECSRLKKENDFLTAQNKKAMASSKEAAHRISSNENMIKKLEAEIKTANYNLSKSDLALRQANFLQQRRIQLLEDYQIRLGKVDSDLERKNKEFKKLQKQLKLKEEELTEHQSKWKKAEQKEASIQTEGIDEKKGIEEKKNFLIVKQCRISDLKKLGSSKEQEGGHNMQQSFSSTWSEFADPANDRFMD